MEKDIVLEKNNLIMLIYSLLYDCDEDMLEQLYEVLFEQLYSNGKYENSKIRQLQDGIVCHY